MTREDGQMLGRAEIVVPELSQDDRRNAVHLVASKAHDADDLLMLLAMCGLDAEEGR